ncbi:MAG: TIGR02453 family protein [Phyllobacteriaceae bacterium]|nr:TIGR02453 family protein [Phyllobacteriaceae bacterium]
MGNFRGFGDQAIPFLKALEFHMNREWFKENQALYESELKAPMGDLVEELSDRFQAAGLGLQGNAKDSLFRIHRDVRFSKDKRPYKLHVSAILSPTGKRTNAGVFYVQVGLEGCFSGIAWYMPEPPLLETLRRAVVTRPSDWRTMVAALKKSGLVLSDEDRLTRPPRGFADVTEPDLAQAVRNKHFFVNLKIAPERVTSPKLADDLFAFALKAQPLLDWGRAATGFHQQD